MQFQGLSAYKGDKPYIFVSYAHADSQRVLPLIGALQQAGYRIWFDQGIEAGTEWSNNIAEHLSGCSAFLFFTSKNSVKSENCLDEVAYAKSHNKQALLAYLEEEVVLPSGTDMQTARFQRLYVNRQANIDGFVESFMAADMFDACRDASEMSEKPYVQPAVKAEPEKKRSGNKLIFAVLAAVIVVVAVLAVVLSSGDKKGSTDVGASSPDDTVGSTVAETVELSDSLEDNTFRLDGVVYRLPVSFASLSGNGWVLGSGNITSDTYIGGLKEKEVSFVRDGKEIDATVYNDSENAKKVADCQIVGVSAYEKSDIDFCLAGEIAVGTGIDELIEAYGAPDERVDADYYTALWWYPSDSAKVKAYCYNDGSYGYDSLSIYNCVPSKEKAEAKQEPPAYLADYTAPTELGSDLTVGNVSIEGELYQLPVPLREFFDDGWTVFSGAYTLISGDRQFVTLKKGESTMNMYVSNPSMYKTTLENCVVTTLMLKAEGNADVLLPGDISFGMSKAETVSLIPDGMELYESSYRTAYSYTDNNGRTYYIELSVDKETDSLYEITVKNEISGIIVE